jgi:hypothetical protein
VVGCPTTPSDWHSDGTFELDLDGIFARLQASGADTVQEPTEQPYGVRDCAFRDPAGNLVRINELRRAVMRSQVLTPPVTGCTEELRPPPKAENYVAFLHLACTQLIVGKLERFPESRAAQPVRSVTGTRGISSRWRCSISHSCQSPFRTADPP